MGTRMQARRKWAFKIGGCMPQRKIAAAKSHGPSGRTNRRSRQGLTLAPGSTHTRSSPRAATRSGFSRVTRSTPQVLMRNLKRFKRKNNRIGSTPLNTSKTSKLKRFNIQQLGVTSWRPRKKHIPIQPPYSILNIFAEMCGTRIPPVAPLVDPPVAPPVAPPT